MKQLKGIVERILQVLAELLNMLFLVTSVLILFVPYWIFIGKVIWKEKWHQNVENYLSNFKLSDIKISEEKIECNHEFYEDTQITWIRCKKCGIKYFLHGQTDVYSKTFLYSGLNKNKIG